MSLITLKFTVVAMQLSVLYKDSALEKWGYLTLPLLIFAIPKDLYCIALGDGVIIKLIPTIIPFPGR